MRGGGDFEEEGNPDGSDADGSVTISESKISRKTRGPSKACTPINACFVGYIPSSSVRLRKLQICPTGK